MCILTSTRRDLAVTEFKVVEDDTEQLQMYEDITGYYDLHMCKRRNTNQSGVFVRDNAGLNYN